jgi:mannose-6-phosphate isomerase-like protein (cupin superfamily)
MRFTMRSIYFGLAATTLTVTLAAQGLPPVDVQPEAGVAAQAKTLLAKALASPSGIASIAVQKYPGQQLLLFVRAGKDGGAEAHAGFNDLFIVQDGEANVVTGGTIVDPKEVSPGETRGSKIEGGTPHLIRKGDIMHISPGVPHQTLLTPGKTFTYYVVKIAGTPQ